MPGRDPRYAAARRVLVHRLGSLGDSLVALPSFRLIRAAFPNAAISVLTNAPADTRAPPLEDVLGPEGVFTDVVPYPLGLRGPRGLLALSRTIRRQRPDVAVYLKRPRGLATVLRDLAFLRACGAKAAIGYPLRADQRRHRHDPASGLCEREASRLLRCLAPLGAVDLDDPSTWRLTLTGEEQRRADQLLEGWPGRAATVALSVGTKQPINDWGLANWAALVRQLGEREPGSGLQLLGGPEDAAASAEIAQGWPGPTLNLCRRLSPRESAAAMRHARLFVGPDSGPMHLAAAVGVPCAAIFSTNNPPGMWYPLGTNHRVLHPRQYGEDATMDAIPVADLLAACRAILEAGPPAPGPFR